jgi:hypothetical protein
MMEHKPKFAVMHNRGFHITFENGVTVSIQIGGGNYCDNYNFPIGEEIHKAYLSSGTAEVAVWDADEKWITEEFFHEDDSVKGYVTPDEVLKLLNWAATYTVDSKKEGKDETIV